MTDSHVDRIKPDSYGITTHLENLRRGKYRIPTFQRNAVWDHGSRAIRSVFDIMGNHLRLPGPATEHPCAV